MSSPKLSPEQLAELTRRSYRNAKRRRTEEIIGSKQTNLDAAIRDIMGDDMGLRMQIGLQSGSITEADILSAYKEMSHPTLGKRLAQALKKPVIIGTALAAAAVGYLTYNMTQLLGDRSDRAAEHDVMESDIMQAKQAIAEAYGEKNEELRLMKLTRAVGDF
ncbi:hypothetical protein HYS47_00840 [Candidatus Woesearchaeota archaeon]|nr:hypothetical protein [Candidatus Woesearchaeota archaeon]